MQRGEAQRSQKAMLATIQETKEFYMVKCMKNTNRKTIKQKTTQAMRKYHHSSSHDRSRQCLTHGKTCTTCGKLNNLKQVCVAAARDAKQDINRAIHETPP